jgi:hypothetical protein
MSAHASKISLREKPKLGSEYQNELYALEDVTGEYGAYLLNVPVLNLLLKHAA